MAVPSPASKRPVLTAAFASLALRIQEMATAMSHDDIRQRVSAALRESYEGTGNWCYVIALFGDDNSGDVVYECSSDLMRAPYTCSPNGATVDTAKAVAVVPFTTYELELTSVSEAGRRNSLRDLKQLQAIHDSSVGLGAACSTKESAKPTGAIKVTEAAPFSVDIPLKEAFAPDFKIKLIAPGKGSTAFYTEEMLKRDGPTVFKAGTPMRIDHPTAAEEAERPEGSVHDWGAVLAKDAYWLDSHPKGPGLYSEVKPFSDHAATIAEKGPYAGVSICAWGEPLKENGKVVMREGVPVLAKLTAADGVDMVTRAGAGGMFLTEAARSANPNEGGDPMDAAEVQKLVEAAVTQANATHQVQTNKLLERALRGDARQEAVRILKGTTLIDAAKERVIEAVLAQPIPSTDGVLDAVKFTESVNAAAKREGEYVAGIMGSGSVRGMGAPAPVVQIDAKETERREANAKKLRESAVRDFVDLGMSQQAAEAAADRELDGEVA